MIMKRTIECALLLLSLLLLLLLLLRMISLFLFIDCIVVDAVVAADDIAVFNVVIQRACGNWKNL